LALLVLAGFVCLALLAPAFSPRYGALQAIERGKGAYVSGAEAAWRAVLGRTIYAARVSVLFNLLMSFSVLLLGAPLGMLAGCRGGWADRLLVRLAELVEAFPDLLLLITIAAAFRTTALVASSSGLALLWMAVTLVYGLNTARLARTYTLQIKDASYVLAARNLGLSERRIFNRHVLPVVLVRLLPAAAFQMQAILAAETALSYLGLGVARSASPVGYFMTSWGGMLFEGQQVVQEQPLALLIPAACLVVVLLALTVLGSRMQCAVE
jgi:ABC-type dipeptide/oligopeptide/nickel transport system permease subunit